MPTSCQLESTSRFAKLRQALALFAAKVASTGIGHAEGSHPIANRAQRAATRRNVRHTGVGLQSALVALIVIGSGAAHGLALPQPEFAKSFSPDTIGSGSVSTLTFTISNTNRPATTELAFTDTLPAGMTIATPAIAGTTCTGGLVSATDGGATISLSGGQVASGGSCSVTVNVRGTATALNTSGDLTSSAGNSGSASATLTVDSGRPGFTKSFSPDTIIVGHRSTLTFVIDNSNGGTAHSLNFTDNFPGGMVIATPANASTTCTGGTLTAVAGSSSLTYSSGFVSGESSCSVRVDVTTVSAGQLKNVTGELTSQSGLSLTRSSGKASAVLTVQTEFLTKSFTDDPIVPGGTGTLQFTITNFDRANSATSIAFTDNLNTTLSGLIATVPPTPNPPCGAGSTLTGTSVLTFSGGNLPPEGSCTFSVAVTVPGAATPGSYINTTSAATAIIGGASVVKNAASDTLVVAYLPLLTKTFTNDPVAAGDNVTLEFTITNTSPTAGASEIAFTDVMPDVIVTAVAPPASVCGGTATFVPRNNIDPAKFWVSGASLAAGAMCTFSIVLTVEASASGGFYTNVTSPITATVGAAALTGRAAMDTLQVVAAPRLKKTFTSNAVAPGGTVTLEFTLTNEQDLPATAIAFADDLGATLTGLAPAETLPKAACGGTLSFGAGALDFSGGSLAAGSACTFSVLLQVPTGAAPGSYTNTTGAVTATVAGVATTGNEARAVLNIAALAISKSFTDDPVAPGGTVNLQFVISNLSPTSAATNVVFGDNLDATLSGLVAVGLPLSNPCGANSQLSGTSSLTLSGGNLLAGTQCTFDVTLQVPAGAGAGEYLNVTSAVSGTVDGDSSTGNVATDKLHVVVPLPDLSVSKTNTVSGATTLGNSWSWRSTISNGGNAPATFTSGQTLYTDTMPNANIGYGTPSIGSSSGITGTGTISCVLSFGNVVECTASGGSVSIAAPGNFRVDVTATPTATGTFINPTGGLAKVDPNNNVAESKETNNDSNSDGVVVGERIARTRA